MMPTEGSFSRSFARSRTKLRFTLWLGVVIFYEHIGYFCQLLQGLVNIVLANNSADLNFEAVLWPVVLHPTAWKPSNLCHWNKYSSAISGHELQLMNRRTSDLQVYRSYLAGIVWMNCRPWLGKFAT